MTLPEANALLLQVDCHDSDAVAHALTERARAIAEFAALSSQELLAETFSAGQTLLERLEFAQIEARRELDRMTSLSRGLQHTLEESQTEHVQCFG